MDNTSATNGQQPAAQKRSVAADMAKRAAPEAPAAAAQATEQNAGQKVTDQGADKGANGQGNGGAAAGDLEKLPPAELAKLVRDAKEAERKAREGEEKIAKQHKKVLGDWNSLNMKVKTSAEKGEIASKTARELTATAPGIDPANPFTFLQRDVAEKNLQAIEKVNPEARFYFGAFMQNLSKMSEDEAEQVAREFMAEPDELSRIAYAVARGKEVLPQAKLALMQRVAKAGDPLGVIEEVEGNLATVTTERDTYKARVAELEAQLAVSVPSRAPLRSAGSPENANAGGKHDGDDKPLASQMSERRKARYAGR